MSEARVIYISSPKRSGSTLLDHLLGAHPQIVSIGEALQLKAYVLEDRRIYDPAHPLICSCGERVSLCSFWSSVQSELGVPLSSLHLRTLEGTGRKGWRHSLARHVWAPVRRWPQLYRLPLVHRALGGDRLGRDCIRLYDAVARMTGARYVVDSSKVPFRFWSIDRGRPQHLWLIMLSRDYRAVAYSQSKRGRALQSAARSWMQTMKQIEVLAADLPEDRTFKLRYEDLCEQPESVMRHLCRFLDLDFVPAVLTRAAKDLHHLGGSPSKFDPARHAIALDRSYLDHLTPYDQEELRQIAGEYALRWGYR